MRPKSLRVSGRDDRLKAVSIAVPSFRDRDHSQNRYSRASNSQATQRRISLITGTFFRPVSSPTSFSPAVVSYVDRRAQLHDVASKSFFLTPAYAICELNHIAAYAVSLFFKMQYMPGGFYASLYNQTANLSSYPVLASPDTIANSPQSFHPFHFNPATYVCPVYQQPIQKTGRLIGMCGLPTGESCDNCCSFNVCICSRSVVNSCFRWSN